MSFDLPLKATPEQQKERFVQSLKQALVANKYSQRELCEALGITIGTLTKYLRGAVDPSKVGVAIMRNLAKELGFTTNTLLSYFETGEYQSSLTIDDVASWIRSEAGNLDLPVLLSAMSHSTEKAAPVEPLNSVADPLPTSPIGHYTDEQAKRFQSVVRGALEDLMAKGSSARKAWAMVEEAINERFDPQESDLIYDVMTGGIVFTGEIMNATSTRLAERFPGGCPLVNTLMEMEELKDYQPLQSVKTWELMAAA